MTSTLPFEGKRIATHLLLALFTAAACFLTLLIEPHVHGVEILTIGLGYAALLLLVVSLIIGPVNLFLQRRNPVNLNLRRDIGIWTGITGGLHVLFGFQVHMDGQILLYFAEQTHHGYRPLLNLFGLSNDVGALATLILIPLLALSNDLSLHWLKGHPWKFLQRFTYLLFVLVIAHTLGYQVVVKREPILTLVTVGLAVLVIALQGLGFFIYWYRQR